MNDSFAYLKTNYRKSDSLNLFTLALLYIVLAKITLSFFSTNGVISVVWPSSGLALAGLLLGGWRYWPGVFLGALLGNIVAGNVISLSFIIACGNTLEALTGLFLLTRVSNFDNRLSQAHDYLHLVLTSMTSAWVSALIGNAALLSYHLVTLETIMPDLIDWWLGDTLGMILVTPFILVWRQLPRDWFTPKRRLETIACFGLAFLVSQIVFLNIFTIFTGRALGYWMFLFVAWAAIRYGRHGVLLLISMIVIHGLLGFVQHKGFFGAGTVQTGLFNLTCYVLILTIVGIGLALIIRKRYEVEQALRLSEQRLLTAQRMAQLGNWEWNVTRDELFWSEEVCLLFGVSATQSAFNYAFFLNTVHPDDRQLVITAVDNTLNQRQSYNIDYRVCLPSGELRYIHAQAELLTTQHGELLMIGTVQNITERKLAEEALQLSALVYENSSEAMMITDARNKIIATNPAFTKLTGYSEAEVLGKNPSIRKSGRQDVAFYQNLYRMLNLTGQWQGEIWNRHKSGEIRAEWLSISSIYRRDGAVYRRVSLFYDITQRKSDEALIWRQANFDNLTELPNRHMFHDRLEQYLKKAQRYQQKVVLLFLDLDRFKEINDSFGHSVGDALLRGVAARLNQCIRESDTIARLGGDEFTIILTELHPINHVDTIAQYILSELVKPFYVDNRTLYISTSIGITVYPDDADNAETLMKNADQALYSAKEQGRNRCCYFTPAMEQAAQKRMQLATDLRIALEQEQFLVYYQPIVTIATGEIHKAEALIRWQHPTEGLISPSDFIPIAEETGLIVQIGEWVFQQVIQQVMQWREQYYADFQISINKSPIQLHNKNPFYQSWPEQLKKSGIPGQSIVVEITEGMLLEMNEAIRHKFMEFRDANIQVSLDDFGTGYSSLSYLRKFDIDYLKIDQSFVRNLKPNSDDMVLCEAIIVMAHKLGIKVIAEGIETTQQLDLLAAAVCDYGQGYLFSCPVPAKEFELLLSRVRRAATY